MVVLHPYSPDCCGLAICYSKRTGVGNLFHERKRRQLRVFSPSAFFFFLLVLLTRRSCSDCVHALLLPIVNDVSVRHDQGDVGGGSTVAFPESAPRCDGPRMMARGGGHVLRYHAWEWNMSHDGEVVSITRHSGRQDDEMIRGASWGCMCG